MAGVYIVGSLILICMNITALPAAFLSIIEGAFAPEAVLGAGAGITVREAIRYGVARGLFSNEAGYGFHTARTCESKSGIPASSGTLRDGQRLHRHIYRPEPDCIFRSHDRRYEQRKKGRHSAHTGGIHESDSAAPGIIFVAVCLFFFAFSTILSWHFFGLVNVKYLFGEKASKLYSMIVVVCIVIGSCLKLELVWSLADFFNGLMVIPNVLALLALSGLVVSIEGAVDAEVF